METKKHIDAVAVWDLYKTRESLFSQLSIAHAEEQRVLRYCASDTGNFMEAVALVLQHSEELRELRKKIPPHYLSHESERIAAPHGRHESRIVRSITADETKDVSKTEHF